MLDEQTGRRSDQRLEEAKELASRLMHMHYCEGNTLGITEFFAPQFTWVGAGEEQYFVGYETAMEMSRRFQGTIPTCSIQDEEYDVVVPADGVYVVSGRMWIATAPDSEMYLKVHQRMSFVFRETDQGLRCVHIHCSNPYQELIDGELFPEKVGKQSYEYVQQQLAEMKAQAAQQNRQLEVIMSSIAGGLKISRDDGSHTFVFVSREAAGLFGYTVEEFLAVTGGTAIGAVYPPDLEHVMSECEQAFRGGRLTYSTRYRVRCKDGSLKWIIDSGKRSEGEDGSWVINSLYLDVTKSEMDAQRLRDQTRLLASIYDTVPCGIVRISCLPDGGYNLISMNRAALSILGYGSMEESLDDWDDGVLGAILEEDRGIIKDTYRTLKRAGDRQDCEVRVRWRDGSLHWLEESNMVIGRIPDGAVIFQRMLMDVTPRKLLQQQLEQEQEMYRVAMESSSDIMFEYWMDTDLFVTYEPRPGQSVIRRELPHYSELLASNQFIHPDDVPIVIDNICNGRAEVFEVRTTIPESGPDEYYWHRVSGRLILKDGWPSRVVGTLRNIQEMKETLSENSERLHMSQSALQAVSGVYISIFYVNLWEDRYYGVRLPQAGDAMSFPRTGSFTEELCRCLLSYVEEGERARVAAICDRGGLLERFSHTSSHVEVEFRQSIRDVSTALWLRLEIHPVSVEKAEARTAIVTLRNVSSEKQIELERQAEERAAKHALEEAYEGARRANYAKSEFLSRMSHDIRTPMNAILGMAAIAQMHLDDREKVADCLMKINLSGGHLLDLINKVLDMSKIESGSTGVCEKVFSLNDILDAAVQIIRVDAERKKQQLTLDVALGSHAVCGDPMRVQQILLNLLSNAVKYTEDGGHIFLKAQEKLSGRSGVCCIEFTVEDDGIGMSPEFLEKLYIPFERAEDSRVSRIQGTGLGMAITSNLVQMMNGTIQVESQVNQGTKFVVNIFLKVAEQETQEIGRVVQTSDAQTAFAPGTRVLLTEDNELNREIAQELLAMAGIETACAVDGRQAVQCFASNPPGTYDLILMDIRMPVMDGYEATEEIRRLGRTGERPDGATIPIIALTADAFADDVYRAQQAGMNEHLSKPLEPGRLMQVLNRWIGDNCRDRQ